MAKDQVKISVVITCHNEREFISEAINSVLNQIAYSFIKEIVVVDDGSQDGSKEIIQAFAQEHEKINPIFQENQGLAGARNTGIEATSGDYIAFLDGDDIWKVKKLEVQMNYAREYAEVGLFYTNVISFNDNGRERLSRPNSYKAFQSPSEVLKEFFTNEGPIIPSTTLIKRECFEEVGLFDTDFDKGQDTDMWLRIAASYPIHHVDEYLVRKRVREDSLGANSLEKAKYLKEVVNKAVENYPELRPIKGRRLAFIEYSKGYFQLKHNDRKRARENFMSTIRLNPKFLKAYLYLIISFFPNTVKNFIWKFVKKTFHISRSIKDFFARNQTNL